MAINSDVVQYKWGLLLQVYYVLLDFSTPSKLQRNIILHDEP